MIVDHLKSRHMDISKYNVFIDHDNNVASFPLWNLSGQLVGYLKYNPYGSKTSKRNNHDLSKYYSYVTSNDKHKMITSWGLETLDLSIPYLFIVEGIFNAVRLHNLNIPAIAVLCNDPVHLTPWVNALGKQIFSICDGDENGQKLAKYSNLSYTCPPDTDLSDLSNEEVIEIVKFFGVKYEV